VKAIMDYEPIILNWNKITAFLLLVRKEELYRNANLSLQWLLIPTPP
jgi:hypothetical protein